MKVGDQVRYTLAKQPVDNNPDHGNQWTIVYVESEDDLGLP